MRRNWYTLYTLLMNTGTKPNNYATIQRSKDPLMKILIKNEGYINVT